MKRLLLIAVVLAFTCCSGVMAQTWHWALSGGYNPTTVTTAEGLQAWTAVPWGGGAYWESVASDSGTALRIVDTDPAYKVRWDSTPNLFKNDVASGMTVSFRIKLESSALASGSSTTYTVFRFSNHLLGATTRNKIQYNLKNVAGKGNCLINSDYAFGLDGSTPAELVVEDHAWHTCRSLHTVNQDGTVRYRVYWDGQLVQDYSRTTTNTDAGKLGTDSSANIFTYQLDYFAVSLDGAWSEEQLNNPCELVISSGPDVNLAPDKSTATITWTTNELAQTSSIHYGDTPSCSETVIESGGPKTNHSVTIPVGNFKYVYYYVESINSTCPRAYSATKAINTGVVQNISFEDLTQDPWIKIPEYTFDGIGATQNWGIWPRTGSKCAHSVANYGAGINGTGAKNYGGMYQIVSGLTPGEFYEASVWIWTRTEGSPEDPPGFLNASCRIGIDPTAGTYVGGWSGTEWAENSDITWSPWEASDNTLSSGGPWKKISCAVRARGTTATIYIQQQHMWPVMWNLTAFDDAWLTQAPPPPPGIGDAKGVRDGFPALLPDKVVTASWPGENRFCVEEDDRSAGIRITVPPQTLVPAVGQKATIAGDMATNQHGERYVIGREITVNGTGTVPAPLGMSNKSLGEKANSALLVKVWGKVLENPLAPGTAEFAPGSNPELPGYDPYPRYYMYIDDGSGVTGDYIIYQDPETLAWTNSGLFRGIKVYYHPDYYMPNPGEYVICTGLAGFEMCDSNFSENGGEFSLVRTIEMRETLPVDETQIPMHLTDILVYPPGSY